jgi:hypothetical protein
MLGAALALAPAAQAAQGQKGPKCTYVGGPGQDVPTVTGGKDVLCTTAATT